MWTHHACGVYGVDMFIELIVLAALHINPHPHHHAVPTPGVQHASGSTSVFHSHPLPVVSAPSVSVLSTVVLPHGSVASSTKTSARKATTAKRSTTSTARRASTRKPAASK